MTITTSQCELCNWYRGGYCEAFKGFPPEDIFNNEFIHDEPYEGDNGIMFRRATNIPLLFQSKKEGREQEYRDSLIINPLRAYVESKVDDYTMDEVGHSGPTLDRYLNEDVEKTEGAMTSTPGASNPVFGSVSNLNRYNNKDEYEEENDEDEYVDL